MISFKTVFKIGPGLVVAGFLLCGGGTALAKESKPGEEYRPETGVLDRITDSVKQTVGKLTSRNGSDTLQTADASAGKKTETPEPEKKSDEPPNPGASNPLKEAFKKLVGKDEEGKGEEKPQVQTEPATKKAETKPASEKAGTGEQEPGGQPKEGMIQKAFKQLIGGKEKADEAKEKAEGITEKTAGSGDAVKKAAEEKQKEQEDKTAETAKKFISETIEKIVETVKGDGNKEPEGSEGDKVEQAKVVDSPKPKAEPKSELEPKKNEAPPENTDQKTTNPLKEAFKKLVGKGEEQEEQKENGPEAKQEPKP